MREPIHDICLRLPGMKEMIAKARKENLLFYIRNLDRWFTPDELVDEMERGSYRKGIVNWTLWPISEYIASLDDDIARNQNKIDELLVEKARILELREK